MRLLLSGGGDPDVVIPLDELFVKQIDLQKHILYIPIAIESFTYSQCFDWFKNTYNPYGITNIEMCTDLKPIKSLNQYTAVFIGGGNTFKLLNEIKESHFDIMLLDYLNNDGFVYGGSAGAIIFGNTINSAGYLDKNNVGLNDLSGLNLVNGNNIWCHYSEAENEAIKNYDGDFYILYEESGLFIKDEIITNVGKKFLRKSDIKC